MRILSAPISVNLVLTEACNLNCRHCYNFWRPENKKSVTLAKEKIDKLIAVFKEAGIFHVIINGGEPFARFEFLEYTLQTLNRHNFTFSCNSNLILATDDMIKKLLDLGLDHILTSLNSYDAQTNDFMVSSKGAHSRITKGIETAVKNGMRVSANMIIGKINKDHVYKTGLLAHNLGCGKFFGTRSVPNVVANNMDDVDSKMSKEDYLCAINDLLRLKIDTGIMIGTLVSYPLCMLGDLEKYRDFVGRGCPSQSGNRLNINPNGDVQVCVHSNETLGNIFEQSFKEIWAKTLPWHDGSLRNPGCAGCKYIDVCMSGCRITSSVCNKTLNAPDPLMTGPGDIYRDYKLVSSKEIEKKVKQGCRFTVPKRIRFRQEEGFFVLNIRWANAITVDQAQGEILKKYWASGKSFSLAEFGEKNLKLLVQLFFKDAIESGDLKDMQIDKMLGCSFDPSALR